MRSRLILLRHDDPEVGRIAQIAWDGLSGAVHHHSYELQPTTADVRSLLRLQLVGMVVHCSAQPIPRDLSDPADLGIGMPEQDQSGSHVRSLDEGRQPGACAVTSSSSAWRATTAAARGARPPGTGTTPSMLCSASVTSPSVGCTVAVNVNGLPEVFDRRAHAAFTSSAWSLVGPGVHATVAEIEGGLRPFHH